MQLPIMPSQKLATARKLFSRAALALLVLLPRCAADPCCCCCNGALDSDYCNTDQLIYWAASLPQAGLLLLHCSARGNTFIVVADDSPSNVDCTLPAILALLPIVKDLLIFSSMKTLLSF